jgi:Rps23 Pro-64 3,4-dihydroxylase Tpa1-like proline 4-hydroxylase
MINQEALAKAFAAFHKNAPIDHCVIDNFLNEEVHADLEKEFLGFDSPKWRVYKNALEDKKALNDWDAFPAGTYRLFNFLNSNSFLATLSKYTGVELIDDPGMHGGGWHIHGPGGNLNPHLDYSIHPKLGLQRKINLIIYFSRELTEEYGGHLGLWEHDPATQRPGKLVREIAPKFNRAVIFDTTQNSWHGMSRPLTQPAGIYRKSFAVYYLCTPSGDAAERGRALFAPREEQKNDPAIEELIKIRSSVGKSSQVYQTNK